MKWTIEVDCTPKEARALLGLPDLEPMQGAVLAQVEKRLLEAASAMSGESIVRSWLSLLPVNSDYWKSFSGLLRPSGRSSSNSSGEPTV